MQDLISTLFDDLIVGTGKRATRLVLPVSLKDSRTAHVIIGYAAWIIVVVTIIATIRYLGA